MNITKTAMITVCGRPNVGKSSLTNALVGEKIAIVSDKPQTTRNRIYGVVNREDTQYILLATPGLHKPKSALGDYMVKVVTSSLSDVDCALLLVEPEDTYPNGAELLIIGKDVAQQDQLLSGRYLLVRKTDYEDMKTTGTLLGNCLLYTSDAADD